MIDSGRGGAPEGLAKHRASAMQARGEPLSTLAEVPTMFPGKTLLFRAGRVGLGSGARPPPIDESREEIAMHAVPAVPEKWRWFTDARFGILIHRG